MFRCFHNYFMLTKISLKMVSNRNTFLISSFSNAVIALIFVFMDHIKLNLTYFTSVLSSQYPPYVRNYFRWCQKQIKCISAVVSLCWKYPSFGIKWWESALIRLMWNWLPFKNCPAYWINSDIMIYIIVVYTEFY